MSQQRPVLDIIPIPKNGDLNMAENYMGVDLSYIVAKAFNKMMLNRRRTAVGHHQRESENGFRTGSTTVLEGDTLAP